MKDVVTELAKCKDFGHKFDVDAVFWQEVEEIVAVLKPAYQFTTEMQRDGYGLSDFYIGWIRVTINLTRIKNKQPKFDLASKLLQNMEIRSSSVFNAPLMLCAIYLDPRIMYKLTDEQKAKAATDLLKIHERVSDVFRKSAGQDCSINDTLDEIHDDYRAQHNASHCSSQEILQMLSIYETEKPHDIRAPVMDFWLKNTDKYQLIRPLADLLHAVPSNQCSTERAFSGLSYIFSKHRMSMNPQNVSNVLMIRLNKDIFYSLRQHRIQQILNK